MNPKTTTIAISTISTSFPSLFGMSSGPVPVSDQVSLANTTLKQDLCSPSTNNTNNNSTNQLSRNTIPSSPPPSSAPSSTLSTANTSTANPTKQLSANSNPFYYQPNSISNSFSSTTSSKANSVSTTDNSTSTSSGVGGTIVTNSSAKNKPKPLRIVSNSNVEYQQNGYGDHIFDHPMMTDQLLHLMRDINISVRDGNLNAQLSTLIFKLYDELKSMGQGEVIEQVHRDHLNRVFVSLRQACCRDNGQLGTPCRLKIMELIELRAMGWRTNFGHSQYYVQRHGGDNDVHSVDMGPVSAPPFGQIPMNPFGPFSGSGAMPGSAGPTNTTNAAQLVSANHGEYGQPQYYLIPATSVPQHTQAGIAFVTPANATTLIQPPHHHMSHMPPPPSAPAIMATHAGLPPLGGLNLGSNPLMHHHHALGPAPPSAPPIMGGVATSPFPRGMAIKGRLNKPYKVAGKNQYRDEVVIRNADSGKITPGAKERTLTITGPTEESVDIAKELVDTTIRRNASPTRDGSDDARESNTPDSGAPLSTPLTAKNRSSSESAFLFDTNSDLDDLASDPKLLEVAKVALREYFERHAPNPVIRRSISTSDDAFNERKERRKSMPPLIEQPILSSGLGMASATAKDSIAELNENICEEIKKSPSEIDDSDGKKFISTPNLVDAISGGGGSLSPHSVEQPAKIELSLSKSDPEKGAGDSITAPSSTAIKLKPSEQYPVDNSGGGAVVMDSTGGRMYIRVVYTREFLLQCARSPLSQMSPPGMGHIASEIADVLRPLPGKFDPQEYKNLCAALRQSAAFPFA